MFDQIDLNQIQQLLIDFAKSKGLTEAQIHENWHVDYKDDAQATLSRELNEMRMGMELFQTALGAGDLLTAKSGLIDAAQRSFNISDYFERLNKDIWRAIQDFDWPEWPESPDDQGYKIPAHYNYKGMK
jgi:hypothetical protein